MKRYLLSLALFLSFLVLGADAANIPYTCPRASTTVSGCVQIDGTSITSTNGVISSSTGGSGNVTGPLSSTANDLAAYSGTTGKILLDSGILMSNVQLITGLASPVAIGNTTPNSVAATTLSASGTLSVGGAISGAGVTALFASPPPLGSTSPNTGAHTTLSVTGQITSTLANGTAPFVVTSSTQVGSLNVSMLAGSTWLSPGAIGSTTPNSVAATTLSASGTLSVGGAISGAGVTSLFASPPALGGTAPAAVNTTLLTRSIPNAGTTGTTQFLLAKLTGAGTAVVATTSDTGGVVLGVVQSASATTGNAQIAIGGQATCTFDGATTQDDFVQISTTAGGDCHDTGSGSFPTTGGQVIGRVLSTHAAGGNFVIDAFGPGIIPGTGGGGSTSFTLSSKTGSYSINATTDVGVHFDNNGASATVPFTLPTGANGLNYCVMNLVAGQSITVTAPAGIKISNGEVQSGAAGVLTLPNFGDGQCLEFLQSQWFAYNGVGTWSLQ